MTRFSETSVPEVCNKSTKQMELIELFSVLQGFYVEQYEATFANESLRYAELHREVALEVATGDNHRNLYVIDFLSRDAAGNQGILEVIPDAQPHQQELVFSHNNMVVVAKPSAWDSMNIAVAPPLESFAALDGFEGWFDRWIDLDRSRLANGDQHTGIIHSIALRDGAVDIDFGTAEVAAAQELFDLLTQHGTEQVMITNGRSR